MCKVKLFLSETVKFCALHKVKLSLPTSPKGNLTHEVNFTTKQLQRSTVPVLPSLTARQSRTVFAYELFASLTLRIAQQLARRANLVGLLNKISDCNLQSLILLSKPVSRVLSFKTVIYLRRTFLHGSSHLSDIGRTNPPCGILSMLHRVGFTEPRKSPSERWSLTPPFHPYQP